MPRILLVDDDAVIIKLYQVILKSSAFELEVAPTGNDMLLAIAKQKPDVILLDVVLPDFSGLDLCNKVKNDPTFTGTKIILVSGQEISPVQIAQGIEMGADDYLVKPFHPKELLARIKNCVKLKIIEEALRDKNRELKDLSNHLQHVREEERKMLAYEVQEELGQLTAALKMDIDWMAKSLTDASDEQKERMLNASNTAKLIITNVRKIASTLRPSMLDELGLHASLEWHCKKISAANGIPCVFEHDHDDENIPVSIKTAVFRICQDALLNIVQHANASKVIVKMQTDGDMLSFSVNDNGKGFDMNQQKSMLGIVAMRERIAAVNGQLQIESIIGQGTTLSLQIPID